MYSLIEFRQQTSVTFRDILELVLYYNRYKN